MPARPLRHLVESFRIITCQDIRQQLRMPGFDLVKTYTQYLAPSPLPRLVTAKRSRSLPANGRYCVQCSRGSATCEESPRTARPDSGYCRQPAGSNRSKTGRSPANSPRPVQVQAQHPH
jgi:hypothetical protein